MKRIIFAIFILAGILTPTLTTAQVAVTGMNTYFPYPSAPDSIPTPQGKADYVMEHFWDYCDLKKAFSSRQKMAGAFEDFMSFSTIGSARKVHRSIGKFLRALEKQPDDLLFIARKAEELVHSDTSRIYSDELYIPFALAVARNKKIDKNVRSAFERQARILTATQPGMPAPVFNYTDFNGGNGTFMPDTTAELTVMFFNDPDCIDCTLARARLNAAIRTTEYIKDGILRIVAVTPGEADDRWRNMASSYPSEWQVLAAPDVDDIYDIRTTPAFYVFDKKGDIVLKNIDIEQVLRLMSLL